MALTKKRAGRRSTFAYPKASSTLSLDEYTARLQAQAEISIQRSQATSQLTMDRWFQQQQYLLRDREDRDALDRISQGDGAYGMSYAQMRSAQAQSEGDTRAAAFWQDTYDRAKEKAQDTLIQGLLKSGEMDPEELLSIITARRDKVDVGSPEFVTLSQDIATVRNSIIAGKTNEYLAGAYAEYIKTGDSKGYMGALMSVFTQTKEETVRQALTKQINDLKDSMEAEVQDNRSQVIGQLVVGYYADRVQTPAAQVLFALEEAARLAKDPTEAGRYIQMAKDITSRETALGAAAARAASGGRASGSTGTGSGGSAAETEEAAAVKANYDAAEKHLKEDLLDKGAIPTDGEWAIYWAAGDKRLAAIQSELSSGVVSAKTAAALQKEVITLSDDRRTYKEKAAANIVSTTDRLQGEIAAVLQSGTNAKVPEGQLYETVSGLIAQMHNLADSPFLSGETAALEKVQANVRQALAPVQAAFDVSRASYNDENNIKSMIDLRRQYQAYTEQWINADPARSPGGWKDFNSWLDIMLDDKRTFDQKATDLGLTHLVADPMDATKQITKPVEGFTPSDVLAARSLITNAQSEMDTAVAKMRTTFALINNVSPEEMQYVASDRMSRGAQDAAVLADVQRARNVVAAGTSGYGGALVGGAGVGIGRAGRANEGLIPDPDLATTRFLKSLVDMTSKAPQLPTYTPGGYTPGTEAMPYSTFDPGFTNQPQPYPQPSSSAPLGGGGFGNDSYFDPGIYTPPPTYSPQNFGLQRSTEPPASGAVFDPGFVDYARSPEADAAYAWLDDPIDISQWLPQATVFDLPPIPIYQPRYQQPTEPPPSPIFDPGLSQSSGGGRGTPGEAIGGNTLTA